MSLFGEDVSDAGELALIQTKKIMRVVQELHDTVEKLQDVVKTVHGLELTMAKIEGQMSAKTVNVGIQSDNIKNIGVAEGGSKVEQSNG